MLKSLSDNSMVVLGWNVKVTHDPQQVRNVLNVLLDVEDVEVAVLMEASRLRGHLNGLGYQVVQLAPHPLIKGNVPGDSEVAVLVRNDLVIKKTFALRMKEFWKGPKLGNPQDPRVYQDVRVKRGNKTIKFGGAHVPFGKAARAETQTRLVQWALNTITKKRLILILDANMRLPEFRETIADPAGLKADGYRIDLAAYKNVKLMSKTNLGNHGSDHPVMVYSFDLT